jgi:hypothetical protein
MGAEPGDINRKTHLEKRRDPGRWRPQNPYDFHPHFFTSFLLTPQAGVRESPGAGIDALGWLRASTTGENKG